MHVINNFRPYGAHIATPDPQEEPVVSTAILLVSRSFTGSVNGMHQLRYTEGYEYELPERIAQDWARAGYGKIVPRASVHDAKGTGEHQSKVAIDDGGETSETTDGAGSDEEPTAQTNTVDVPPVTVSAPTSIKSGRRNAPKSAKNSRKK